VKGAVTAAVIWLPIGIALEEAALRESIRWVLNSAKMNLGIVTVSVVILML